MKPNSFAIRQVSGRNFVIGRHGSPNAGVQAHVLYKVALKPIGRKSVGVGSVECGVWSVGTA